MSLVVEPVHPEFAAAVSGVDLTQPVDTDTKAELNRLWARYAVLVFRRQPLTPPQFMAAAEIFGTLWEQSLKQFTLPDFPLVGFNSTRDLPLKDGKLQVRGENFHTDHSNYLAPPKATSLVAVKLPSQGGDTQFVDVRWAYDELPLATKARILGLRSPHGYESSNSPRQFARLDPAQLAKVPVTKQPIVIRHPVNGRSALYLNTGRMEGIDGMERDEGFVLVNDLYDHATQARYEYRHRWAVGDLVIWDNRSVMHQANADYDPKDERYLYRIMLAGQPLDPAAA